MHDDNATIRVTKMRVNFVDTITWITHVYIVAKPLGSIGGDPETLFR